MKTLGESNSFYLLYNACKEAS